MGYTDEIQGGPGNSRRCVSREGSQHLADSPRDLGPQIG